MCGRARDKGTSLGLTKRLELLYPKRNYIYKKNMDDIKFERKLNS